MNYEDNGFIKRVETDLVKYKCMISAIEVYQLFCYAKKIPKYGVYLEMGSMYGGSLYYARKAIEIARSKAQLISIEVNPQQELIDMIDGHDPVVTLIRGRVENILPLIKDNSIDLIFHDTDIGGNFLKQIIYHCGRILKKEGILIGHDYLKNKDRGFIETKQAVDEFFSGKVRLIEGTILYIASKKEIISAEKVLK